MNASKSARKTSSWEADRKPQRSDMFIEKPFVKIIKLRSNGMIACFMFGVVTGMPLLRSLAEDSGLSFYKHGAPTHGAFCAQDFEPNPY